jgi:hypothetical protein
VHQMTTIRGSEAPECGHFMHKVNSRGWWCLRDEVTVGRVGTRGVVVFARRCWAAVEELRLGLGVSGEGCAWAAVADVD